MRLENWNPPIPSLTKANFEWGVPYAALVHEGGEKASGEIYPARPFVDSGIAAVKPEETFVQEYQKTESLDQAFVKLTSEYDEQFKEEMLDPKWEWPNVTTRQSGEVVGSPRDIFDTGALLNSQTVVIS